MVRTPPRAPQENGFAELWVAPQHRSQHALELQPRAAARTLTRRWDRPPRQRLWNGSTYLDARTGPPAAALMSLNMLVETEGRNYTPAEYGAWLGELGFHDIRTVWFQAAGANGAVIGRKP